MMSLLIKGKFKNVIGALVSINRLEERGMCTKSYFIPSILETILAPQTRIID